MGHRHLYGLAELQSAGLSPFELVGACDPNLDNANSLADQAEERLGTRPQTRQRPRRTSFRHPGPSRRYHHLTGSSSHRGHRGYGARLARNVRKTHGAYGPRLQANDCQSSRDRVRLSVAENYRRDPVNRLAKSLLDAGVIGRPRLMQQIAIGGGDGMLISVWRHPEKTPAASSSMWAFTLPTSWSTSSARPTRLTRKRACTNRSAKTP